VKTSHKKSVGNEVIGLALTNVIRYFSKKQRGCVTMGQRHYNLKAGGYSAIYEENAILRIAGMFISKVF
jgi:hypothetical protein